MPAKRPPQTFPQMVEAEQERKTNRLYKAESSLFVDGQITDLVTQTADELEAAGNMEPISLTDVDKVKDVTARYIRACAEASTLPSISGLARSLGLSRQAVYDVLARNSPKETARWFALCRDAFAEMLETSSLRNNINTITSIFLLKAGYGYQEKNEIVVTQGNTQNPFDELAPEAAAELAAKYSDIPDD